MSFAGTFAWVYFVPLSVFTVGTLYTAVQALRVRLAYRKTLGTVIEPEYVMRDTPDRGDSTPYAREQARFSVDGSSHIAQAKTLVRPSRLAPGTIIPVFYDPQDPKHARLGIWRDLWLLPTALGVLMALFGLLWLGKLVETPEQRATTDIDTQLLYRLEELDR